MKSEFLFLTLIFSLGSTFNQSTLFEHYTGSGIHSGLLATTDGFLLNGKPFRIISGAIHYFRVHPHYWRDRLRKLKALGATAVETYVPWNLHEPQKDSFDFGGGHDDMSPFLDIVKYIKLAQEEDLFVIFRPGPYICSEWDFGGLPSWLLSDYNMRVRSMYPGYITHVDKYFEHLMPLVANLQFTQGNGPIIAVQIENEFGAFGYGDQPRDKVYLAHLRDKMSSLGIKEMYLTSDDPMITFDWGAIEGALQTANFQSRRAAEEKALLAELQPNRPFMVTEFWTGWFDHWFQAFHEGLTVSGFSNILTDVLALGGSVNMYMFHGGTNFGFMNGANTLNEFPFYLPDTTSYDYDAPLSEAGDYIPKYFAAKEIIEKFLPVQTLLPKLPPESVKRAFPKALVTSYLTLEDLLDQVPESIVINSPTVLAMEDLPINNGSGQSFGFTVYRKTVKIEANSQLKIRGHIRDFAQVLINGQLHTPPTLSKSDLQNFGSWVSRDATFHLNSWRPLKNIGDGVRTNAKMDIMVENMGRVNFGRPHDFYQLKGLWEGPVSIDGSILSNWTIIPLEFKGAWVRGLQNWKPFTAANAQGPVAVRATFVVDNPADTFLDMSAWGKGVVFINGFNLGRYWTPVGPQVTLYLPAPLLNVGVNTVTIFEQFKADAHISFSGRPKLGLQRLRVV